MTEADTCSAQVSIGRPPAHEGDSCGRDPRPASLLSNGMPAKAHHSTVPGRDPLRLQKNIRIKGSALVSGRVLGWRQRWRGGEEKKGRGRADLLVGRVQWPHQGLGGVGYTPPHAGQKSPWNHTLIPCLLGILVPALASKDADILKSEQGSP